ncbi:MAG: Methylmalonyl-CoA mutase [Candidatus Alkanophagales archaeon MCA70_species_2]|nr:Methylmalonyl-CoA mutase [Candidatus Alkanophaga liquidiphilum]RLG37962.1 MAG: methylmalonyl-CoA mutase [Candidatus Alkanophagales archaeon]
MLSETDLKEIERKLRAWEETCLRGALRAKSERKKKFTSTTSSREVKRLYTPLDVADIDYLRDIGFPGEYPFTRGIHATMYRGRLFTMRQFAGFGTAEDTNERYKYLLENGQTGLSVAFDLPTLMGRDSDHPLSRGEVGKCGVAVDSLKDMEIIFDGIPLGEVTTSMTINSPANVLLAMYIAVAEKQGVPSTQIGGTVQNDILKEYIAQKEYIFPPEPSVNLIVDTMEFCSVWGKVPKWNTISISGYHIREAGATAVQELAFTLADGMAYVEAGIRRNLPVDKFAPRLSFFFNCHNDFFEEIAKFRAARRIWARYMREEAGAQNPRSWMLRFHVQNAGCSLTAQQPLVNIVRTTIQALAAVLGGCQSLHTNSYDEALCLPTELAVTIALRTQQVIAHESGVTHVVDPLGGSYYVEALTSQIEKEANEYFEKIKEMGDGSVLDGVIEGIKRGYFQKEIADSAYEYQKRVESKDIIIVGVNEFATEELEVPEILYIGPEVEERQIARLKKVREERDEHRWRESLENLKAAADKGENTLPYILEAIKAYATVGEIMDVLRELYGEYTEPVII